MTIISRFLTPAMHRFLSAIRDSEDEYAIQEGREVWVDCQRFSPRTVTACLRLCLIRELEDDPQTHIWELNGDGRKILNDPDYEPPIIAAFRDGRIRSSTHKDEQRKEF